MARLNHILIEGTLQKWSTDDGPVSYKVKYSTDIVEHENLLWMTKSQMEKYYPLVGETVRIVGHLEGSMIVVEYINTLGD